MSSADPTSTVGHTSTPSSSSFPGGGGGGNQTSNLYLYTFLATLLLLLAISVIIVGRSIVMRRRARRTIDDAVRNGTWLPQAGRPAVKLGDKPKLFDVYTTAVGISARSPTDNGLLAWANLKPLSVMPRRSMSTPPPAPVVRSPTPSEPPPSLLLRLAPQLRPPRRVTPSDSSVHPLETLQPPHSTTLTVSVMIAMPAPPTAKPHNPSEDPFPPVQVGVAHLPIPHGWATDGKSESG